MNVKAETKTAEHRMEIRK